MIKIALAGGNSQVGTEVAVYLSLKHAAQVTALVRSRYVSALLRLASIQCRIVDYGDKESMQRELSDYDVVVDFTYPAGQLPNILRTAKKNLWAILRSMKPGSRYIYMSSIMALGMPEASDYVKEFVFPRTSYGYIKRALEQQAQELARQFGIKVFIYRLGQVHGVLQSVAQEFLSGLSSGKFYVRGSPTDYTNTVFCCSIAEAVMKCVHGHLMPGIYTVVSSPPWTLQDLLRYYQMREGWSKVCYVPAAGREGVHDFQARWSLRAVLASHRGLFETYILLRFPFLFPRIKGLFRIKMAHDDITLIRQARQKVSRAPLGKPLGACIPGIESSFEEVLRSERLLERMLLQAIDGGKK